MAEENHQLKIDLISDELREIAYKGQQATIYQIGDEVEVASQVLGFIGSYLYATILYPVGALHYKVQYKTLVTDDETAPLQETVRVSEVRPVPPTLPSEARSMVTYDIVDVYDKEAWWFGVITGEDEENYHVYFPTTGEHVAYSTDKLRFHQEWSNGQWIFPSLGRIDFL
ncbi:hypothetical protein MTR67_028829 [Solanum verrucosum]|uniref:Agenet domain-containing protein n=1 Tax=Solanum verrucosum TaxID=315347 RepID=A0AAF0R357_SOLVR|nr:hypothetical protein MTR67_028829 [Solanum verrucosum]